MITLRHSRVGGNPWLLFPFSMITLRHSRVGGNPWLLFPFSMITLCHSRVGGNPWLLCSFSMITLRHSRVGGNPWLLFPFSMTILRHSRVGGNPWLLFPFSMRILRHSRVGGSMVAVPVLHDNTVSFPRRRESIEYDTSFVGWAKRSVPNALKASVPDVCQSTRLNCQTAKSDVPTSGFSGCWSHPCRVLPWLCWP